MKNKQSNLVKPSSSSKTHTTPYVCFSVLFILKTRVPFKYILIIFVWQRNGVMRSEVFREVILSQEFVGLH